MTTLNELEALAKAVYGPTKDDWELKQALYTFDKAANPETILAMIALIRQLGNAMQGVVVAHKYDGGTPVAALNALKEFEHD